MAKPTPPPYRTALVTGASSGLGRGLAFWLAERGVEVYAAARRNSELETLRNEGRRTSGGIITMVLDVAQTEATLHAIRALDARCGGLDLVVANAGTSGVTDARNIDWGTIERIIDVNVKGAAATLAAALPSMVARNRGHLVGISSIVRHRGVPQYGAYAASKAFLSSFLESLRIDLHDTKVDVSCIEPGFIKTELTERNKFHMPFLMDLDEGVQQVAHAIVRREKVYRFPWPTKVGARVWSMLPNRLLDAMSAQALSRLED